MQPRLAIDAAAHDREPVWVEPFQDSNQFVFDSEQVSALVRLDITRTLTSRLFGGFQLLPHGNPDFRAGMWASRAGEVIFGGGYVTPAEFKFGAPTGTPFYRTPDSHNDGGVLWIYRTGGATIRQGGLDGDQETGSAWFMNAGVPGVGATTGTSVLAITLPSKALRDVVGHSRHIAPRALPSGTAVLRLMTGYIESARQLPADTDPALLEITGKHLIDLAGSLLGPTRDAAEQAEKGGLRSARLDAVLRAVKSGYRDPEFSVARIAAQLGLSVRYVQDILHQTGASFAERVLELRLEEACELLGRAHVSRRKVSDIAFSCGFNNLSYFHRAFRRRYGMTPAGARSSLDS